MQRVIRLVLADSDSEMRRFESFSIGAGWCQALSDYSVDPMWDVHSQGARFSSGSALGPSHDGIRRMRRTNLPTRPCRKTYGRHRDSKRTRLIHRPCGDITPPVGGIHVSPVVLRHKCALTARSRRSSPGHAAAASSLVQRNSVPSTHMRCMMTASRRATATIARFIPRCRAIFMPQALSHDHLRL